MDGANPAGMPTNPTHIDATTSGQYMWFTGPSGGAGRSLIIVAELIWRKIRHSRPGG